MKNCMNYVFILVIVFIASLDCQWFEKRTLQSTVLLEKIEKNGSYTTIGAGVLLFDYQKLRNYYVVTCKHLIEPRSKVVVRLNTDTLFMNVVDFKDSIHSFGNIQIARNYVRITVDFEKQTRQFHPSLDIVAFELTVPNVLINNNSKPIEFRISDLAAIPKSGIKYRNEMRLGDEVYFTGFPLGLGVTKFVEPIVRSGSVAWMPDEMSQFYLDAFSFGGNSGSPVFEKRILGSNLGELGWSSTKLLGMVTGHLQDSSNSTKNTQINVNAGLAECVYIDDMLFVIEKLKDTIRYTLPGKAKMEDE